MAAITLSVCLQKGGAGKTTTAQNLAAILGAKGHSVLLVDCDGQANATMAAGVVQADKTITDVLAGEANMTDVIITPSLLYQLAPSDIGLVNFEAMSFPADRLHMALSAIRDRYDYIVLDSPPALGNLLKNVLFASDHVIIPLEPKPFAVHGVDDLQETLQAVQAATGRAKVLGLLLVKYNARTVLSRNMDEVANQIADEMGTSVFATRIRESITVPESQAVMQPLIEYAPKAAVTRDYVQFTEELLRRIKG